MPSSLSRRLPFLLFLILLLFLLFSPLLSSLLLHLWLYYTPSFLYSSHTLSPSLPSLRDVGGEHARERDEDEDVAELLVVGGGQRDPAGPPQLHHGPDGVHHHQARTERRQEYPNLVPVELPGYVRVRSHHTIVSKIKNLWSRTYGGSIQDATHIQDGGSIQDATPCRHDISELCGHVRRDGTHLSYHTIVI